MPLDDIVTITITTQTAIVSRVGFGVPCVMAYHTVFPERAREYTSTTAMISDGFTATDDAVRAVGAIFSQSPKPTKVVVGREENTQKRKIKITPVTATLKATYDYIVYVNGKEAKYTTDATPTVAEITAGLKTAIDALSENVTTTDNTTDLDIEANTVADNFRFVVDERQILHQEDITPDGSPDGIVDDITAVRNLNDTWYSIHLTNLGAAVIKAAAAHIETLYKIMITSSADDEIYDSGVSDDVGSDLQTAGYARTALVYHHKALEQYPGAAWAGKCLPKDPGSITWKFKTLAGVDSTTLTASEYAAIKAKDVNLYNEVAGISITEDGITSAGEFIDVTRTADWTRARMQENIFSRLANSDKVPYTDVGVGVIEAEIRGVLDEGVRKDVFTADPAPTVTVPKVADVAAADRAARLLPDVAFNATLAGAIHKVEIAGVISV